MVVSERLPSPTTESPYRVPDNSHRAELHISWVRHWSFRLGRVVFGLIFMGGCLFGAAQLEGFDVSFVLFVFVLLHFCWAGLQMLVDGFGRVEIQLTGDHLEIAEQPFADCAGRTARIPIGNIVRIRVEGVADSEEDISHSRLDFAIRGYPHVQSVSFDTEDQTMWVKERLEACLELGEGTALGE